MPHGNTGKKNALGNKGGGSHTVKEQEQHLNKWNNPTIVRELEAKIASGTYSISDVYYLKCLKADTDLLKNLANKVLADLTNINVRGKIGHSLALLGDTPNEISENQSHKTDREAPKTN